MEDYTTTATLEITFIDGTTQQYEFTQPAAEGTLAVSRIKHIIESNCLMLEIEDTLKIFPMQNIRSLTVHPAPQKVPETTLMVRATPKP